MRSPRVHGASDIYHVIARGTGKQLIFEDDFDRTRFLSIMSSALEKTSAELYAWCLMGNHVHLLIHAPLETLSQCMKLICGEYARHFNERHERSGHLFQERYRSEPVETDEYLMTVIRYIHLNPETAGISSFESYWWSSYSEYVGMARYCSTEFVLSIFGSMEAFVSMHLLPGEDERCLELGRRLTPRNTLGDEMALDIARNALGTVEPSDVKTFERGKRDSLLRKLKATGLPLRKIERITGISKSVIARA